MISPTQHLTYFSDTAPFKTLAFPISNPIGPSLIDPVMVKINAKPEDVILESLKVVDRVDVGAEDLIVLGGGERLPL